MKEKQIGFHPTLVLAQLEKKTIKAGEFMFPSHIGSRSTIKGQQAVVIVN